MHDDGVRLGRLADLSNRGHESAHVVRRVLVANHGAGQGVDHDGGDPTVLGRHLLGQLDQIAGAVIEQVHAGAHH
jgi:hypothetical protein